MTQTRRLAAFAAVAVVALALIAMASNSEPIRIEGGSSTPNSTGFSSVDGELPQLIDDDSIDFDRVHDPDGQIPGFVAWIFAAAVLVGVVWFLGRQRFALLMVRRNLTSDQHEVEIDDGAHAQAVADFADDLIEELELGADPRLAIRRAYANVETGFGRRDLARRAAETPMRYLERVLGRKRTAVPPLRTLTALFEVARFSEEPITDEMRSEAVEALREIKGAYTSGFGANRRVPS